MSFIKEFKSSLVTPGCTTTSISSELTLRILFIFIIFIDIPPLFAKAFPSNDVPVPHATIGHSSWLQIDAISDTSLELLTKATASGKISGK